MTGDSLPFGSRDLVNAVRTSGARRVQCCVRGCAATPLLKRRGDAWSPEWFCDHHGIRTSTSRGGTYVYRDIANNVFVGRPLLEKVTKQYRHQLANETSEDAVSWNLFVGLQQAGLLEAALQVLTGESIKGVPDLYLWGNRVRWEGVEPWDALLEARRALERRKGTPTEPDIALHVAGRALILIEAKLGSANGTLARKEERWPTVREWLDAYRMPKGCEDPLDRGAILAKDRASVLEQLCRNAVFAAKMRSGRERVWVINLLRKCTAGPTAPDCEGHLRPGGSVNFRVVRWEDFYPLAQQSSKVPLSRYLEEKTLYLKPAFDLLPEPS